MNDLSQGIIDCMNKKDATLFAAIAEKLFGFQGIYPVRSFVYLVYIGLDNIELENESNIY